MSKSNLHFHKWQYMSAKEAHGHNIWCPWPHEECIKCKKIKSLCKTDEQRIPHWTLIPEHWEAVSYVKTK